MPILHRLFATTPGQSARPARKASLGLEQLDSRELMSVTAVSIGRSAAYSTTQIEIRGDNNPSQVSVKRIGTSSIEVRDTTNGFLRTVPASGIQAVVFFGGEANDRIDLYASNLQLRAYGFGGHDTLVGNGKNDVLYGGTGNDSLYGWGGNDKLVGEDGQDLLVGEAGDDVLIGGANADTLSGGSGTDTFRRGLVLTSQHSYTDWSVDTVTDDLSSCKIASLGEMRYSNTADNFRQVDQTGSWTCAFLSSLAAVAERTTGASDLVQRIVYDASNDKYGIDLHINGAWKRYWVTGDWTEGRDPNGALWVTLYQKAYLEAMGVPSRDADGRMRQSAESPTADQYSRSGNYTSSANAFLALTGKSSTYTSIGAASAATIRAQVFSAATTGMVVGSKSSGTTAGIVARHCYMIYNCFQATNGTWFVTLYNPFGTDTSNGALDSQDDGFVTVSWSTFKANFNGYTRV